MWILLSDAHEALHGYKVQKVDKIKIQDHNPAPEEVQEVNPYQEKLESNHNNPLFSAGYYEYLEGLDKQRSEVDIFWDPSSLESKPKEIWRQEPDDVVIMTGWFFVDNVYMSPPAFRRFKELGESALPRTRKFEKFTVYNFFGIDAVKRCEVDVDVTNYTAVDVSLLIKLKFRDGVDLGLTAGAGSPDGAKVIFNHVSNMAYTNYATVKTVDVELYKTSHYKHTLVSAVNDGISQFKTRIPSHNKIPLTGDTKLICEYSLDNRYPIIASWGTNESEQWSIDFWSLLDRWN